MTDYLIDNFTERLLIIDFKDTILYNRLIIIIGIYNSENKHLSRSSPAMKLHPFSLPLAFIMVAFIAGCGGDDNGGATGPSIPAPSDLTAIALSDSSVRLNWRDNSYSESGFRIERKAQVGEFSAIFTTNVDVKTYIDTAVTEGLPYEYRVFAITPRSSSIASNIAAVHTPPKPPTSFTAVKASGTQINLNWADNSAIETAYEIERRRSGAGGGAYARIAMLPANTIAYSDTGLTQNITYTYHIRALKDTIPSVWSGEARATTTVPTPNKPANLRAQPMDQHTISLTWDPLVPANERGFVIEQSLQEAIGFAIADSVPAGYGRANIGSLVSNTTYFFRIYAYNDSGRSPYSETVSATTLTGPPGAPTELAAVAPNYRCVVLTWRDNSVEETGFRIEKKITTGTRWDILVSLPANTVGYVDSAVTPSTSYSYRLYAFNDHGQSGYTNEARVTLPNGSPNPPTAMLATAVAPRQVNLSWTDNSEDELGFTLHRRPMGGSEATWITLADSLPTNTVTHIDNNVSPQGAYGYRIQAFNRIQGNPRRLLSAFSNEDTAMTPNGPPSAPSNLRAAAVSMTQINLQWQDNSNNETEFLVERRNLDGQTFAPIGTVPRNRISYPDTGLVHSTMYAYRVKALNEVGESEYSNIDSARTTNPVVFRDDFESYPVGQSPGGEWSDTIRGTSWIRVTNAQSMPAGGKSVQFHDPDVGANFCALDLSPQPMVSGTISFYIFIPQIGTFGVWGGDQTGYQTFTILFRTDGNIYARSGANFQICGAYALNQWLHIKISYSMMSHTYSIYVNDQAIAENLQTMRTDHFDNRRIRLIAVSDGEIPDVFIDNFMLDLRQVVASPRPLPPYQGNGLAKFDEVQIQGNMR